MCEVSTWVPIVGLMLLSCEESQFSELGFHSSDFALFMCIEVVSEEVSD